VTSRSVREKKNPESHRASHRKDMSPLTQGLNYRSACDILIEGGMMGKTTKGKKRLQILSGVILQDLRGLEEGS